MKKLFIASVAALAISTVASTGAQATIIYGVDENNNLLTFDSATPGTILSSVTITGMTNSIGALDFRPLNNALYALGADKVIYTINLGTGAATAVSGVLALSGTEYGFDFNPTIDRLRIVSNANDNYVFDPNSGSLTVATAVTYAAGDPNFGLDADVTALAYTSSTFGAAATTTQLYAIDTANDVLARQANSAGTLNTVGALGANLGSRTSFDIAGSDAFVMNGTSLFRVNLATGALTNIGSTSRAIFGIAVSTVPETGTWAMMIVGFGMMGGAMRYRRDRTSVRYA